MFKRIIYEDWVGIIKISSFVVVGCIFLIGIVRAFCLPKAKRDYLSNLPLEDNPEDKPAPAPTAPPTSDPNKP